MSENFIEITILEFIDSEKLYNKMMKFTETPSYSLGLERLRFESQHFTLNGGTSILIALLIIAACIILGIINITSKYYSH